MLIVAEQKNKTMKEQFLIIKCGYEGIEDLCYLTNDSKDVIYKILSLRKDIQDNRDKVKDFDIDLDGDEWEVKEKISELYVDEKISYEVYSSFSDNPDQYCVQKWNGKEFNCCCKELGVEASETWLY